MTRRAVGRHPRATRLVWAAGVVLLAASTVDASARRAAPPRWVLGVSAALADTGRREEMICAVKAQALASGRVAKVVVARAGGPAEQSADIRRLVAQGADAIVIDPSSPTALNAEIARAASRGVEVVAVGSAVTARQAYAATTDQVAYGRLGAEWLFRTLGGRGNVVEMRGVPGVSTDTARHTGFLQALRRYPGVKVVRQTFTGWRFAAAGEQMLAILASGLKVNGVWTSGTDYTVVNAFTTARRSYVPVVGADTNAYLRQQLTVRNLRAAAVTDPAAIAGVGAAMAIRLLAGASVPRSVVVRPEVWDNGTPAGLRQIRANYAPRRPMTASARLHVRPWTTYTRKQLLACKGP